MYIDLLQKMKDEFLFGSGRRPRLLTFSGVISYIDESCFSLVVLQLIPKMLPSGVITVRACLVKDHFIGS